ncbi:MAG: signal peptidase II [Lachnospiraceae bacterium]|nr:signal peptidase II [Lachnospiraceae bacterium]
MKTLTPSRIIKSLVLFIVLVAADLVTKALAASRLGTPLPLINNVLEFHYLENHGAAFSLLQDARVFFIIITAIFLAVALYVLIKVPNTRRFLLMRLTILVIMAGAVGNLVDRIVFGYVRDFIYFSLIDFPIFNVADIYVSVGVAVLVLLILFVYKNEDFDFLSLK